MNANVRQRLDRHRRWLAEHEPTLRLVVDPQAEHASIVGNIEVPIGAGGTAQFQVEIRYQQRRGKLNPFVTPDTYDSAKQFEPHPDRHIDSEEGHFCMWLPQMAPRDFDQPNGLKRYLDRVREFIVLQLMFEDRRRRDLRPYWPGAQWSHGVEGHRQWVREQVADLDANQLRGLAGAVGNRRRYRPGSPCPCRSGRSYRRCHRQWVYDMRAAVLRDPSAREEFFAVLGQFDAVAS